MATRATPTPTPTPAPIGTAFKPLELGEDVGEDVELAAEPASAGTVPGFHVDEVEVEVVLVEFAEDVEEEIGVALGTRENALLPDDRACIWRSREANDTHSVVITRASLIATVLINTCHVTAEHGIA